MYACFIKNLLRREKARKKTPKQKHTKKYPLQYLVAAESHEDNAALVIALGVLGVQQQALIGVGKRLLIAPQRVVRGAPIVPVQKVIGTEFNCARVILCRLRMHTRVCIECVY